MKLARLVGSGLSKNDIFNASSPNNRDGCFLPYVALKNAFANYGYLLQTGDMADPADAVFELHQDVQITQASHAYAMLFETPLVNPENGNAVALNKYRKVFTWNDEWLNRPNHIKFNFPNHLPETNFKSFNSRPKFSCMIAGNKAFRTTDIRELYSKRVETIQWFENNAPRDFDLYGSGWNLPAMKPSRYPGIKRKIASAIVKISGRKAFPSYRGRVESKLEVLANTKFCICYENAIGFPGYITEKIFDCFFAGCVPVYWGPPAEDLPIPQTCYINRRNFESDQQLYSYLKRITEAEYINFQSEISTYLVSPAFAPFGTQYFVDSVVNTVVQDLETTQ